MPRATLIRRCAQHVRIVAAALIAGLPAHASPPSAGVVVLKNGNVLEGTVRQLDRYFVVEREGASLQVPADQVEMACSSLVEAYERRRQERVGASADAHLELARWCVTNGLLDQAAREALDARLRDPGHPGVSVIEMRIRQALEIEAARRERAERQQVEQTSPAAEHVASERQSPVITPPPEAQTQFVRSIQPMLVQGCATGGCHQPGAPQQLQLDRWALEGNGNPDLIRANLESVLTQIDADDPASSQLILRARKAHGTARTGVSKPLTSYQAAMLLDWLNAAAGVAPAAPVDEVAPAVPLPLPTSEPPPEPTLISGTAASTPVQPTKFKPRDAFDPEIFNRQIAAEAQRRQAAIEEEPQQLEQADQDVDLDAIGDEAESSAVTR